MELKNKYGVNIIIKNGNNYSIIILNSLYRPISQIKCILNLNTAKKT